MKLAVNQGRVASLSPADRAEVEKALREFEAACRANPLMAYNHPLFSRPHARQIEFHAATSPLKLFLGGNRSGKTTAGMADDIIQAIDRDVVPEHLQRFKKWEPPFYARVVIPDLGHHLDGVVLQKIREWCPPSQLRGGGFDRAWDAKQHILRFANGSWIQFMSNEQDVDKFGGAALHRVHYDEEPRKDVRNECLMRLIDYAGDEIFTLTPLLGLSWLFTDIYEPHTLGKLPEATVLTVDMDDNPHLDAATMERALAGLSKEERAARKSGRFVHFAGLVYPQFDRDFHVVPEIAELPAGVKEFQAIDPGIRHMTGVVFCYLDSQDTLVVFDEIGVTDLTVEQIAVLLHESDRRWGSVPLQRIIDPSARNRNHVAGLSVQYEFQQHRIYTVLGNNSRQAGINAVKERLDRREPAPGLLITANCVELIAELGRYRWSSPPRSGEGRVREEPVRRDDDVIDALRYVCMSDPVKPRELSQQGPETVQQRWARARLEGPSRGSGVLLPGGPGMFT